MNTLKEWAVPEVIHVTNSIIIVNVRHLNLLGCYVTLTSKYLPTVQRSIIFAKIFILTILKFYSTYVLRFYTQLGHNRRPGHHQSKDFYTVVYKFFIVWTSLSRSKWPRGLRRRSTAARLLKTWFRIPPGHGYLSVVSVVCCQVEVSWTSWSLVQRSPTECGVIVCDLEKQTSWRTTRGLSRQEKKKT
jgi:hypothetical protein